MNGIRKIKSEALKYKIGYHFIIAIVMSFFAVFGVYGYLDLKHNANITDAEFSKLTPERVVYQKVLESNSERPVLYFKISSGQVFERGIHTPNFMKLKSAVEDNEQIDIWYGYELSFPHYLKALMPKSSPPIYQIMANEEIILPFELMRQDHIEKASIISYVLLGLGISCLVLVWFSLLGIRARLQLYSNNKKTMA